MWNDLRYAARQLAKKPAFSLTVIFTLALCIGANTAVFSVIDKLFFRSLPYPDAGRLVMVTNVIRQGERTSIQDGQDGLTWQQVRDRVPSLESAVYSDGVSGVNLFAAGQVRFVQQQRIGAGYFHVLGALPLVGREFTSADDAPNGSPLAVLSYGLWLQVFQADPQVIGRTIDLRGAPYVVVGIMPQSFITNVPADVWTPLRASTHDEGSGSNYHILARLKPDATVAQANTELTAAFQPIAAQRHMPAGIKMEGRAIPLEYGYTIDMRQRMNLMWAAVGMVLLIGCVNIASLMLARAAERERETATRLALGATRGQIVRHVLIEAMLLAMVGGVLGMIVGRFALKALLNLNPNDFLMWGIVTLDWRVLWVALAASCFTGLAFGIYPAWEAASSDCRDALAEGNRSVTSGSLWKRQLLVGAQVALGVVLVAVSGLLIHTLANILAANAGFNGDHVVTASLSLQDERYKTSASCNRFYNETLAKIRALPGVEYAAVALTLPYERPLNVPVEKIPGRDLTQTDEITDLTYATPDMFPALQIPLLRGRLFADSHTATSEKVMVVNQAFAEHFFRGADAVGQQVTAGGDTARIVGIVGSVAQQSGWGSGSPLEKRQQIYLPAQQISDNGGGMGMLHTWFSPSWIVRTRGGDAPGIEQKVSVAVQSVDPRLPFSRFRKMSEIRGDSMKDQSRQAALFGILAGLAVLILALGLYGMVAQMVTNRTREMGIRLALGATPRDVIRTAMLPGLRVAFIGAIIGIVSALFATRLLEGLIWGVTAYDPVTFIAVALLIAAVAALASLLPALRLAKIDPAQTLRTE